MYKGVIFDLDGTLVNSIKDLAFSCNKMLEEFGLPTFPVDDYRYKVGNGIGKLVERALPEDKMDIYPQALARFTEIYQGQALKYTDLYPGIKETLDKLAELNIPMAICTNKNQAAAEIIVKHFFGGKYFQTVLGDIPGAKRKPDPGKVLAIAEKWGIAPADILYLGDSDVDMQTGVNAQMAPVGVLWGFRDKEELVNNGAQYIIQRPEELIDLVKLAK